MMVVTAAWMLLSSYFCLISATCDFVCPLILLPFFRQTVAAWVSIAVPPPFYFFPPRPRIAGCQTRTSHRNTLRTPPFIPLSGEAPPCFGATETVPWLILPPAIGLTYHSERFPPFFVPPPGSVKKGTTFCLVWSPSTEDSGCFQFPGRREPSDSLSSSLAGLKFILGSLSALSCFKTRLALDSAHFFLRLLPWNPFVLQ